MNLLPSPDQVEIVDTLRTFLSAEAPVARFRPPAPQVGNADARLWPQLAEMGFLGVAVQEHSGGIGLSASEEMLVCRELGRHLVSPAVLGLILAAHLAERSGHATLLKILLSGHQGVGLANARGRTALGELCDGDFHLIDAADTPWVLVCDETGAALLERERFQDRETLVGTDNVLGLQRARLDRAQAALWLPSQAAPLYVRAQLLLSGMAVGMAEATRDMAVEYAKVREQFGKPIGSFQAIKHLCADMAIRSEAALCQTSFAALVIAEGHPGADFHATAAKIVATEAAQKNAAQNIQVHGAVGFTSEADPHVFLKRSHVIDLLWGGLGRQRERLLDLPWPEAA